MLTNPPAANELTPSLVDRLMDDDPAAARESAVDQRYSVRQLKEAIRYDLTALLNTRRYCGPVPTHLTELEVSLVNYGLPDWSGVESGTEARSAFAKILETAIRKYEPRLQNVRVDLLSRDEPLDRTLRFRVVGLLYLEQTPEPLSFETSVDTGTGRVTVGGDSR